METKKQVSSEDLKIAVENLVELTEKFVEQNQQSYKDGRIGDAVVLNDVCYDGKSLVSIDIKNVTSCSFFINSVGGLEKAARALKIKKLQAEIDELEKKEDKK